MQTQLMSGGEKLITIGGGETVRLFSDLHIKPETWVSIAGHALTGTRPHSKEDGREVYRGRFAIDLLEGPGNIVDPRVSHIVVNGDYNHTFPSRDGNIDLIDSSWNAITQAIIRNDLTSEDLTLVPGNHSPISTMPQGAIEQLTNRGILVPDGKVRIVAEADESQPPVTFHVRHGHEFDGGKHEISQVGNSALVQGLLDGVIKGIRRVIGVQYFPYGNSLTRAMSIGMNAPQMINAERGLGENEWAIDGHTHLAGIFPPNGHSPKPETNILSREYLESILFDTRLGKALLLAAARIIPDISGIDRWYVTSHNKTGYGNSGMYDPLSQIQSGLDISPQEIALILANVNGGYEKGMMWKKEHPSINAVERHPIRPVSSFSQET